MVKNKEVSKTSRTRYILRQRGGEQSLQAWRLSTPAYNAGGFRVGLSLTRHPPPPLHPWKTFQGCMCQFGMSLHRRDMVQKESMRSVDHQSRLGEGATSSVQCLHSNAT